MPLKLGTFLPQNWRYDPHGDLVNAARAAEEIGYDSVWVFERVLYAEDQTGVHRLTEYGDGSWPDIYRRVIDPIVALSMAAAVTSVVRVGTAVQIVWSFRRGPRDIASAELALRCGRPSAGRGSAPVGTSCRSVAGHAFSLCPPAACGEG
jgi:hypothetical protein